MTFQQNQKIRILDPMENCVYDCTIVAIQYEQEPGFQNITWLYLVADDSSLNINYDPMLGMMIYRVMTADDISIVPPDDEQVDD